ncbi:MAG TPA: tetratricopeptide repeat-containing sensor histidine kinase, partial [Chitinophagaceae bacterium]|nr:tetratricopeptide repeat-containing sensor histidine kinase [Chitinophagaceae bacterium]
AYMLFDRQQQFITVHKGLALAEQLHWKKGIANLHNDLGLMVGDTGNNTLARQHFEESYRLNKELGIKISQVNNLNNIGRSFQRESNFISATDYYFKALAIAREINNPEKIALVGTNITAAYSTQKNYPKAIEYGELTLKNAELSGSADQTGKALLLLGVIKKDTKDSVAAKQYMNRALKVYEAAGNQRQQASVLSSLAALELPNHKNVIAYMLKAQGIFDSTGAAYIGSIGNIANIGSEYYSLALEAPAGERSLYLNKAETYLLRALDLCRQTSNAEYMASVSMSLADLEEQKNNYKAALQYYRKATAINDSLFSQDQKNQIAGMEGKHNLAIKDNEIALKNLTLRSQQRMQWALIALLLLAAIIGALLYWQNRSRKKTNTTLMVLNTKLDEANKIKAKFFGILSHDLRSPIASLINFLHLLRNEPEAMAPQEKAEYQQQISQSVHDLLQTMETMLLWSKEQMANFKPRIEMVPINDLFEYLQKFFASTTPVNMRFTAGENLEVAADENYLKVIMQNLTANAIKALDNRQDGYIEWKAVQEKGQTILSITDNGPGINEEQARSLYQEGSSFNAKTGFGHHLIRDLARAIRYRISVESKPGMGTTFVLSAA